MRYENPEILSIIVLIIYPQDRFEIYGGGGVTVKNAAGVNDDIERAINL